MASTRPIRAKFQDLGSYEFRKYQDNLKTSKNYCLVFGPPPEMKILLVLAKNSWKTAIEHRVCLKCFANDCRWDDFYPELIWDQKYVYEFYIILLGPFTRNLFFLAVIMVVFAVDTLKSNSEKISNRKCVKKTLSHLAVLTHLRVFIWEILILAR